MTWKDITSYSRNDVDRTPSTFEKVSGNLRVCISNGHINYRPNWIMHCYDLGINTKPLKANTFDEAKKEAIDYVCNVAAGIFNDATNLRNGEIE